MLHCLGIVFIVVAVILIAIGLLYLLLRTGFSLNGKPMRFDPGGADAPGNRRLYIEGVSAAGVPISCSF
jgi:hypothetical protein